MAHHFKLIYLCVARHWISNRTGGTLKKKKKGEAFLLYLCHIHPLHDNQCEHRLVTGDRGNELNADGDPSNEEFTPPLITLKEMSGVRLKLHKVLSAYCSHTPNYV